MKLTQEYTADIEHRFKLATIAVLVLFAIVAARLYYLQVIKGSFYRFFSTENSIKEMTVPAVRGMIFDRDGKTIVDNRPSFRVVVTPQYVSDPERMMTTLASLLKMQRSDIEAAWEKRKLQPYYRSLVIKEDATDDEVAVIRARKNPWSDDSDENDLRGIDVEVGYKRLYPDAGIATHVLGYVREIDNEKLKAQREKNPGRYRLGDMIGIGGIEERWDLWLKGQDGFEERIVNAKGREVDYEGIASQLGGQKAVPGATLRLTIDAELQKVARDMFEGKKGAAVVIDVKDGAVLAMFSAPTYDLNKLAGPGGNSYWGELSASPSRHLLNRAIQGGYPPGSTYKIVTAIASLAEGVITPDETLPCRGALMYGGRAYHCWNKGGHGPTSLKRSIIASCDVYYYLAGLRLGVDRLARYAKMFGFGSETGIELSGERSGLIPTSEWKEKRFSAPWQEGETLSISVGQGYDVVTPLQNALFVAEVANGGKRLKPHLVDEVQDVAGNVVYKWEAPEDLGGIEVDEKILEKVRNAMAGVVSDPEGTAHAQSARKVTMGGKTGTAQVVQLDSGHACSGEKCRDHAWFIGFAPADKPEVAAAVIVEHGGFGASAAAPIVGAMLEKYWEKKQSCHSERSEESRGVHGILRSAQDDNRVLRGN